MAEPASRRPRNRHRAESRQATIPRRVQVESVEQLGPGLVRVCLVGDELGAFRNGEGTHAAAVSESFDDVVVFCLPDPEAGAETFPRTAPGGGLSVPGDRATVTREYTVRALRESGLCVDLVRHDSGVGMAWLDGVTPGDDLVIVAPRVSRSLPGVDRMLAVGDATALPAMARLIEDCPPGLDLEVIAVVPDLAALPPELLPVSASGTRVRVRVLEDCPGSVSRLLGALSESALPTDFAWVAGEAGMVGDLRRHLIARGQPPDRVQFTGYWRLGGPL
ncbi:siderophore-interacting protein [Dietzia psychralcaliphila]|uniref:siderophore-interacting protein n=1 Tax=Dietzia psychralcaliphila TaxID=139021 RepID=UPI000D319F3A|nr:siderophore-interacting protein [Dietzia psychralcaliphila]PTM87469.1 NADPH-dependent ferric siderophore reductase [Dietzia psychralcaliphila]